MGRIDSRGALTAFSNNILRHAEVRASGVRRLLSRFGYESAVVTITDSPFRVWSHTLRGSLHEGHDGPGGEPQFDMGTWRIHGFD